ncbi:MAG TPA: serine--tRNA ligase, partial [Candidatus Binataceae bacterium]|nr:serine--tRNA ligase [Candidatus Binataceae bacterium]
MLPLQLIRNEPERVREGARLKRVADAPIDALLEVDHDIRQIQAQLQELQQRRNETSKRFPRIKDAAERDAVRDEMRRVSDEIKHFEESLAPMEAQRDDNLLHIPNLPHESVPRGAGEEDNVEVERWGEPRQFDFEPKPHWDLGEALDIIDFERAAKISGSRFFMLKGAGSKLNRALINFMLDWHTSRGYTELQPPYLVKREAMVGTGQLPKFEEDMYRTEPDGLFLVPTAEVPVTNMYGGEILEPGTLPRCFVAYTACFRREAGAAGRDTRGLIRVHQFDKVELVKFVEPEHSYDEMRSLLADACSVLQALKLPYRVLQLCTADLTFSSSMTFDPEVWMPGQNRYVEISSCSNFEDFQARRANIRYRPSPDARVEFVHTLNGSGVAGRVLPAVMENYQEADGSITVPEVLRP